jgi:ABC-type dipeptide/oligopeptide/nickel transport system permease subunit
LTVFMVGLALLGPLFAPYSPSEIVGIPYTTPNSDALLGTDHLGRDVLSRVLWGGRSVIALAGLATLLAYLIGGTIGLVAGFNRSIVDPALMRFVDVLLAFPPLLLLLVLATGAGASTAVLVIGVAAIHVPGIARVIRSATLEVSVRGYVEAAIARGEPSRSILRRHVLPNISATIAADGGPRLTVSILLVAAVNFLGLGLRPPAADWALMVTENRSGITLQPWALAMPAICIALLGISVNLLADSIARSLGRSVDEGLTRR